jgi:hypothetical protein
LRDAQDVANITEFVLIALGLSQFAVGAEQICLIHIELVKKSGGTKTISPLKG